MAGSRRPSRLRALCPFAMGVAPATSLVSPAATLAGGVPRSSCPVGMVCNTAIGVAVRLPRSWTVEPPGHSAFNSLTLVTIVPGRQNMDLHMDIEPFGTTTARDPLAAAEAGADAATQGVTIPVTRTALAVAGVPAVRLRGLGGAP